MNELQAQPCPDKTVTSSNLPPLVDAPLPEAAVASRRGRSSQRREPYPLRSHPQPSPERSFASTEQRGFAPSDVGSGAVCKAVHSDLMMEIEICPDCYYRSNFKKDSSFIEPCTFPHCIIWAKLKGFPYWPAKALRFLGNRNVNVRFFGTHDRAWIPLSRCYLISEESPVPVEATKQFGMELALQELQQHIECIREKFGCFTYAPARTEFKPEHLYTCDILFGPDIQSKVPDLGNGSDRRARNHSGFGAEESCDAEGLMNDCVSSTGRPEDSVSDTISNDGKPGDRIVTPVQLTKTASKELERDVVSSSSSRLPQRMSGGGSASHRRSSSKSAGGESSTQNGKDPPCTEQLAIVTEETPPGVFSLLDQSLEEGLKDISDEMTSPEMGNESSCGLSRKVLGRVPSSDTNIVDDLEARLAGDLSAGTDASALIDRSDNEDSLGSFQQNSDVEIVSSAGNVNNSDTQDKIADTSAKSQAVFPKKRSLNSCIQKLFQSQKTDAVVSPVIVSTSSPSQLPERQQHQLQQPLLQARPSSNIAASATVASSVTQQQQQLRIANAMSGRHEEVAKIYVPPAALSTAASSSEVGIDQSPQNHAEISKRYSAKVSDSSDLTMDNIISGPGLFRSCIDEFVSRCANDEPFWEQQAANFLERRANARQRPEKPRARPAKPRRTAASTDYLDILEHQYHNSEGSLADFAQRYFPDRDLLARIANDVNSDEQTNTRNPPAPANLSVLPQQQQNENAVGSISNLFTTSVSASSVMTTLSRHNDAVLGNDQPSCDAPPSATRNLSDVSSTLTTAGDASNASGQGISATNVSRQNFAVVDEEMLDDFDAEEFVVQDEAMEESNEAGGDAVGSGRSELRNNNIAATGDISSQPSGEGLVATGTNFAAASAAASENKEQPPPMAVATESLEASPTEIQEEILAQQRTARAAREPPPADGFGADQGEGPAAFLAEKDDAEFAALPETLAAEARHSSFDSSPPKENEIQADGMYLKRSVDDFSVNNNDLVSVMQQSVEEVPRVASKDDASKIVKSLQSQTKDAVLAEASNQQPSDSEEATAKSIYDNKAKFAMKQTTAEGSTSASVKGNPLSPKKDKSALPKVSSTKAEGNTKPGDSSYASKAPDKNRDSGSSNEEALPVSVLEGNLLNGFTLVTPDPSDFDQSAVDEGAWMNDELRSMMASRRKAHRRWVKTRSEGQRRLYRATRNNILKVVRANKKICAPLQKRLDEASGLREILGVLLQSNTLTLRDEKAYVQRLLDASTNALIGVNQLYEIRCDDDHFEPAYLCKGCSSVIKATKVLAHVTGPGHINQYLKSNYNAEYGNYVAKYVNNPEQFVKLTQYAAAVERREGRQPVTHRLSFKLSRRLLTSPKETGIYAMREEPARVASSNGYSSVGSNRSTGGGSSLTTALPPQFAGCLGGMGQPPSAAVDKQGKALEQAQMRRLELSLPGMPNLSAPAPSVSAIDPYGQRGPPVAGPHSTAMPPINVDPALLRRFKEAAPPQLLVNAATLVLACQLVDVGLSHQPPPPGGSWR